MRTFAFAALATLCSAIAAPTAFAYSVTPMSVRVAPIGPKSSFRVTVSNTDDAPLDATFTVASVSVSEAGARTFTPAPKDFVVFPPQATVRPGATQTVLVRYVGPEPKVGAIYVLKVAQQNVVEYEQGSGPTTFGIRLSQDFLVTTLVEPEKAKATVSFAAAPTVNKDGLEAVIQNDGAAVADLRTLPWIVTTNGVAKPLDLAQLDYGDTQFLAPGAKRRVRFTTPVGATVTLGRPS